MRRWEERKMLKDDCQGFCAARNILFVNANDTPDLKHILHLNGRGQAAHRDLAKVRRVNERGGPGEPGAGFGN